MNTDTRRVVVTGMAGISPLGNEWPSMRDALFAGHSGIQKIEEWDRYAGLNTRLGGRVNELTLPSHFNRKTKRTMGRVAQMATLSAERAVMDAGIQDDPVLTNGQTGVAYGSSTGSPDAAMDFARMLIEDNVEGVNATTYIRMMSHTTAVNIALYFGLTGRVVPTSSACTSGSQGIGYAYEAIKYGQQTLMIAGGAEELSATEAAVFDTLYATSVRNNAPKTTPRPFDADHDGLVIGEGAATLILEEHSHAVARGAPILAEIKGFATNCDGAHVTQPNPDTMAAVMRAALDDAQLHADAIGYVNGHGTATPTGDVAESHATHAIFGKKPAYATLKGHIGHTLGACGALEAWATINILNDGRAPPTLNLDAPDPDCSELGWIDPAGCQLSTPIALSTNFAFGGINTALVLAHSG
ncbi:beta-ketoacyl-ACP synthase [Salinisphaera sp. USBA-960]|uniref:beta-ketoacyl-ACP synthase n=1 Tax=Salinisphaera orenii TaxID=856731 RepID=UPI000DBE9BEA|nr:beta-ketoacyl-ACP synthase [Salifodinibacter halophilus]NNC25380.1 beta-ketoacyl-ACP synthase [Salifodinibacter halophilus]